VKYTDVCEAKTPEQMRERFETVLAEVAAKHGGTPESHRATQLQNVGYFSGYYDREVFNRVHEWLGATHPYFGSSWPSPEKALAIGLEAGQSFTSAGNEVKP
jgi:hypothetical protein